MKKTRRNPDDRVKKAAAALPSLARIAAEFEADREKILSDPELTDRERRHDLEAAFERAKKLGDATLRQADRDLDAARDDAERGARLIADALNSSDVAAQMRVQRAYGRLDRWLAADAGWGDVIARIQSWDEYVVVRSEMRRQIEQGSKNPTQRRVQEQIAAFERDADERLQAIDAPESAKDVIGLVRDVTGVEAALVDRRATFGMQLRGEATSSTILRAGMREHALLGPDLEAPFEKLIEPEARPPDTYPGWPTARSEPSSSPPAGAAPSATAQRPATVTGRRAHR